MKNKTILLVLFASIPALVLFTFAPVKASAPRYSSFVSFANDATGLVLTYGMPDAFSPSSFSTSQNSGDLYRLDLTGFPPTYNYTSAGFKSLYNGVVKMSGKCVQNKANFVTVRMQFIDGRAQDVAETNDRIFTFFTFFSAGDFQLLAQSPSYTELKCSILFEVVQ